VLARACEDIVALNARLRPAHAPLHLSVNASTRELQVPGFAAGVLEALERSGLPPHLLALEITESALMDDDLTHAALVDLRAAGVQLAVDDFGTGYSSLHYLRDLPVSALKVDRSFVSGMPDRRDTTIVDSVVSLAVGLGLTAVAEGVEEPQQLQHLQQVGCHSAQGLLISPALSLSELEHYLEGVGHDPLACLLVPAQNGDDPRAQARGSSVAAPTTRGRAGAQSESSSASSASRSTTSDSEPVGTAT
jgi:EAL domain-containing protein (putative c-di-GMP-specific phosphodiesterase class I)